MSISLIVFFITELAILPNFPLTGYILLEMKPSSPNLTINGIYHTGDETIQPNPILYGYNISELHSTAVLSPAGALLKFSSDLSLGHNGQY